MRILITGATGFIGSRLAATLKSHGHEIIGCTRHLNHALAAHPEYAWIEADFNRDIDARDWRPRLYKVDAVINCAGLLRESAGNTFEAVHALGPRALFEACKRAGVRRVLHFSALGAEREARSLFIASKRFADTYLENLDLDWSVLAPAPVFGAASPVTKTLVSLARLPLIPLIDTDGARMAPIHVDDVTMVVMRLLESGAPLRTRIALVGPDAMSFSEYLARLRRALGLGRAHFVPLPDWLTALPAHAATLAGNGFFGREALALLRTDMVADPAPVCELLGRAPRPVEEFVATVVRPVASHAHRFSY